MTELGEWIAPSDLSLITPEEQLWLATVFNRFAGYPTLEEIWGLMDEVWRDLRCDPEVMDARIAAYYAHPVWLLNGLFIEQHRESLEHRRRFTEWVTAQAPKQVADYGGGFGGLARMIGDACPDATVDVIEPHAHPLAITRAGHTANVNYRAGLGEDYDIVIATDVFEHVPDPLALAASTAAALRPGGRYLIANCFAPVILCHLPQTFHFRLSWDRALDVMGLRPVEQVAYGTVFRRERHLDLDAARRVERRSQRLWQMKPLLPGKVARFLAKAL